MPPENPSVYWVLLWTVPLPPNDHACLIFKPLRSAIVHVANACMYVCTCECVRVWFFTTHRSVWGWLCESATTTAAGVGRSHVQTPSHFTVWRLSAFSSVHRRQG